MQDLFKKLNIMTVKMKRSKKIPMMNQIRITLSVNILPKNQQATKKEKELKKALVNKNSITWQSYVLIVY